MKKIHICLEDDVHKALKVKSENRNASMQEFVANVVKNAVFRNDFFASVAAQSTKESQRFRFIDLFAGIGGMRIGFESAGGYCVFTSEWDRFAQKTYFDNFGDMPAGDITKISVTDIPDHEVLVAGFPCQPFSIAGVSKKNSLGRKHGFLDKTQGTLFFDVARIVEAKRPRAFLLENVKNLLGHDKGRTFKVITETLKELDYDLCWKIVDAAGYVPQHRERIFIVGFDKRVFATTPDFKFPERPKHEKVIGDILENRVDSKYVLSDKLWNYLQDYAKKHKEKGNGFGYGLVDKNSVARTLSARYYKDGSEILVARGSQNPRRLTPRECARLMGYPEEFQITVSDTQAYKQFGNSVAVPVVKDIAAKIADLVISSGTSQNEDHSAEMLIAL